MALWIGRITEDTQTKDLYNLFDKYGKISRCDVKKGFAFVEFEDDRDAEDCLRDLDGAELHGSKIVIEWAKGKRRGPSDRDKCFRCGQEGHWARNCTNSPSRRRSRSPRRRYSRSPRRGYGGRRNYGRRSSRSSSPRRRYSSSSSSSRRSSKYSRSPRRSPSPKRDRKRNSSRSRSPVSKSSRSRSPVSRSSRSRSPISRSPPPRASRSPAYNNNNNASEDVSKGNDSN